MNSIKLFTIGFTKKSAEMFFTKLRNKGVKRVVDIRLNNMSQLAGFSKMSDLKYFLKEICGIEYVHIADLAPTADILEEYKKYKNDWSIYETKFMDLMERRRIENKLGNLLYDYDCLLCSEEKPNECHRNLVIKYLRSKHWGIDVEHII